MVAGSPDDEDMVLIDTRELALLRRKAAAWEFVAAKAMTVTFEDPLDPDGDLVPLERLVDGGWCNEKWGLVSDGPRTLIECVEQVEDEYGDWRAALYDEDPPSDDTEGRE